MAETQKKRKTVFFSILFTILGIGAATATSSLLLTTLTSSVAAFAPKHCSTDSEEGTTSCSGGSGNGEGGSGGHCVTSDDSSVCSGGQGAGPNGADPLGGFGGRSECDFNTGDCSEVGGGIGPN